MKVDRSLELIIPIQVVITIALVSKFTKISKSGAAFLTLVYGPLGLLITFLGSAFSTGLNAKGTNLKGTVDSIRIADRSDPSKKVEIILPDPTSLDDLEKAADAVNGKPNPGNVKPVENVMQPKGSSFPDTQDTGHAGKDVMKGFQGNDTLKGLGGNDKIYASTGNDEANGGTGRDTFDASSMATSANINLKKGIATIGNNKTTLKSIENATGTNKADVIVGNNGNNKLVGLNGNDKIFGLDGRDWILGGGGKDRIDGGKGNDNINAGAGADIVIGGLGNDKMRGGGGVDTFLFSGKAGTDNGVDRILDWQKGIDKIKIAGGKMSEIKVAVKQGNTHIDYDEGTIILNNIKLSKGDIDFVF